MLPSKGAEEMAGASSMQEGAINNSPREPGLVGADPDARRQAAAQHVPLAQKRLLEAPRRAARVEVGLAEEAVAARLLLCARTIKTALSLPRGSMLRAAACDH